jgi:flagellin
MANEIDRIATATNFNGIGMLDNSAVVKIHFGDSSDQICVAGSNMTASGLSINSLSITGQTNAISALGSITSAIETKDTARAKFGYTINRLESTGEVLGIQAENLLAAESRISDVDVATEMATLTRNQVLAQAGTSMLAQANSIPQMALTLLR